MSLEEQNKTVAATTDKNAAKEEYKRKLAEEKNFSPELKRAIEERTSIIKKENERNQALKKLEEKNLKLARKTKLEHMNEADKKAYLEKEKADNLAKYDAALKAKQEADAKKGEELKARNDGGAKVHSFFHGIKMSGFCQFFSNGWLKFKCLHPTLAGLIYQIFFFFVFSMGVTIWQYIVLMFLPNLLGLELAGTEFSWPKLFMGTFDGNDLYWNILGYEVLKDASGNVIIGGGLGYFIAFEVATFTAQCINFPLQRNITYKSHGNVAWQIMWYFIGWVLISLFCNAINGLWMPFGTIFLPSAIYNILVMFMTGGISMVIFFFIFMIIFPGGAADTSRDEAKEQILAEQAILNA